MSSAWKIITYYTVNTPYEEEVKNLISSLEKFNCPYKVYPRPSTGSWEKNTQIKTEVILSALNEFPGEMIAWIDADAMLERPPIFFDTLQPENFDLCCYYLSTSYNPRELLSGTLIFSNNETSKAIVKEWGELNKTNKEWDQRNLESIIKSKTNLRMIPLPKEYIKINLHDRFQPGIKDNEVVVRHYQASRKYKKLNRS